MEERSSPSSLTADRKSTAFHDKRASSRAQDIRELLKRLTLLSTADVWLNINSKFLVVTLKA